MCRRVGTAFGGSASSLDECLLLLAALHSKGSEAGMGGSAGFEPFEPFPTHPGLTGLWKPVLVPFCATTACFAEPADRRGTVKKDLAAMLDFRLPLI